MKVSLVLVVTLLVTPLLIAQNNEPVGWWKFDDLRIERKEVKMVRGETFLPKEVFGYVKNSVDNVESDVNGKFYKSVKGVKGKALLLDGNTAFVVVENDNVPRITGDFTVEAWVALGAYPNNVCPIVDNQRDPAEGYFNGYFFGLDALGRLILRIATDGRDESLVGKQTIPLNTWTHVAGTFSAKNGMTIYVNGELAGSKQPDHKFTPAQRRVNIVMGKSRGAQRPYGTIRPYGTKPVEQFYDGLLDEIKIYPIELTASAVKKAYASVNSDIKPELPERKMPTGPLTTGFFGAINTTLDFYEAYDAPWHVDKGADVVVRFDEYPCEIVFWRGANYQAHFVTERGHWFNQGFNEGWNERGSCEPMSDKQTRHSHVKILESNAARVVVQWRYALINNWFDFAFFDPNTGWGDWTNETFYIYPDMVAVREDVLLSNAPRAAHEWQESMVVPGPGQRPEDLLEYAAVTMGNMQGEFHTYSWEHKTPPRWPKDIQNPSIQLVNMKSKYKPFSILRPEDNASFDVYAGEVRRDVSVFPWWNHWPVAQKPTDGRYAMFADRPSHSSLSHWFFDAYEETDRSMTKVMLVGLTELSAEALLPLARSWSKPAAISVAASVGEARYEQSERAFIVDLKKEVDELKIELSGSSASPVINPAFVINGWGANDVQMRLNGNLVKKGKNFRVGHRNGLKQTDLITWLKITSEDKMSISFSKVK